MDLLGSLGTLATNVKNVTLPGVIAAAAFALLLWPPRPYDRIPTIIDNHLTIADLKLGPSQFANDSNASLGVYLRDSRPACTVREGDESFTFLAAPFRFTERAAVAVKNQLVLDDADRSLNKCAEEEQALQGIEDLAIANINSLITTRTSERDGINTLYQKYIFALSPMQSEFRERLGCKELEIAVLQAHLLNFQRMQKERARRVIQLQRLDKEIQLRLQDAGRLRPIQKFDDILSGLTSHIVGFLTLVFGWGLLIDPINRAIFSFIYDNGFHDEWDNVRPLRPSPGDDARKRWEPEIGEHAARNAALGTADKSQGRDGIVVQARGSFARLDRMRSSPGWSVLVLIICALLATIIVFFRQKSIAVKPTITAAIEQYTPAESLLASKATPRNSTFASSTASAEAPQTQFRIKVIVVAPTSPYSPDGQVTLSVGRSGSGIFDVDAFKKKNNKGSFLLVNGIVSYEASDIHEQGDYAVIAEYTPPGNHVAKRCNGRPIFQASTSGMIPFRIEKPVTNAPAEIVNCRRFLTVPELQTIAGDVGPLQLVSQGPGPSIPDVGHPAVTPFTKPLIKCVLVLLLSVFAGFFVPGVLQIFTPHTIAMAQPTRKQTAAFRRWQSGDPNAKLTCEQKLAVTWDKLSEPQYAIGQGLISRSDFEALQNSYYSQSLVSTGLIIPLLFFIFALLVTPQLGTDQPWLYGVLGFGGVLLLITGVDRRHKYLNEVDSLVSSAFLRICAQNEKSQADKKDANVASQVADAINNAKVVESVDWSLSIEDPSSPAPPAPKEPATSTPKPQTGPHGEAPSRTQNASGSEIADAVAEIVRRLKALSLKKNVRLKVADPAVSKPAPPLTNADNPVKATSTSSDAAQPSTSQTEPKPSGDEEEKK